MVHDPFPELEYGFDDVSGLTPEGSPYRTRPSERFTPDPHSIEEAVDRIFEPKLSFDESRKQYPRPMNVLYRSVAERHAKLKQRIGNLKSFPNPKNSFTIRLKKGLTDLGWEPRYVNYAIQNQVNQGWAKKFQMGTAQQFVRKNDLVKMNIFDANTRVNMKLGEIADILPGTVEPRSGDTIFQRTGSPGKTQYFE